MKRSITAYWLGRISYERAHALQERLVEERNAGTIGDTILFLEHDPVITLGRGAKPDNVLATEASLQHQGVSLVETARGGDVTFHGPGQLVAYPILDLKPDRCDVRKYVRDLAEVMIGLARDQGVCAGVVPGDAKYIGVWVDEASPRMVEGASGEPHEWDEARAVLAAHGELDLSKETNPPRLAKIGAIGVRLSRWITMHGFAFNVTTDLSSFGLIVPCGISSFGVTSLQKLGIAPPELRSLVSSACVHFARIFDADVSEGPIEALGAIP